MIVSLNNFYNESSNWSSFSNGKLLRFKSVQFPKFSVAFCIFHLSHLLFAHQYYYFIFFFVTKIYIYVEWNAFCNFRSSHSKNCAYCIQLFVFSFVVLSFLKRVVCVGEKVFRRIEHEIFGCDAIVGTDWKLWWKTNKFTIFHIYLHYILSRPPFLYFVHFSFIPPALAFICVETKFSLPIPFCMGCVQMKRFYLNFFFLFFFQM